MISNVYEAAGGEETFARLVERFYAGVAEDPVLRPLYPDEDLSLPAERLESGTGELRSWTTAAGALESLDLSFMEYYPCYRSPAGTGVAMGFALWN